MAGLTVALVALPLSMAIRLGSIIKFMPFPVTVGSTAAIAIIIFSSQIEDLLGLTLTAGEPGPLPAKLGGAL